MAISVNLVTQEQLIKNFSVENYCVFAFCGKGSFLVDFVEYTFQGDTLLFLSPFQNFQIKNRCL